MDAAAEPVTQDQKFDSTAFILRKNAIWSFGGVGKSPYTRNLRLLPDGRIGGYINNNEHRWRLDPESLTILDRGGQPTTLFDRVRINAEGRMTLTGNYTGAPGAEHYLEEHTDPYGIATNPENFKIDQHFSGPKRRNLVIMGANESSLHHEWTQDIADADRNWDLCLSFYGDPKNYPPAGPVEYTSLQPGVRKWLAIHAAMYEGSPFWEYERIFVLDDDIRTSWSDINKFLDICRELDLQLAQPALKPGCAITHMITRQSPDTLVRFTNFVEAMAPCFTSEALRLCISVTQGGYYGFGIDHLWPSILGLPEKKIGIVDAIAVDHTRPVGVNYSMELALAEERQLFKIYGVNGWAGRDVLGSVPAKTVTDSNDTRKIVLVDVGAAKGLQQKWANMVGNILPILFEPNPAEAQILQGKLSAYPGAKVIEAGLSDRLGAQKLNITNYFGCISILRPNAELLQDYKIAPLFRVKSTLEIDCTRYDVLHRDGLVPQPDVIKIDVQGYEYQVLNGFGALLKDCLAIELEGHFYELYEDQCLIGDLVTFLKKFGFVLRSVKQVDNFDGDCVEVDAIFTKNRAFINAAAPQIREKFRRISDVLGVPPY